MHTLPSLSAGGLNLASIKTNYVFSTTDAGKYILLSASASTNAILPLNWNVTIKCVANSFIIFTPKAGTSIDGRSSIFIYPGETFTIASDGINLFTFNRSKYFLIQTLNPLGISQVEFRITDPELVRMEIFINNIFVSTATTTFYYLQSSKGTYISTSSNYYVYSFSSVRRDPNYGLTGGSGGGQNTNIPLVATNLGVSPSFNGKFIMSNFQNTNPVAYSLAPIFDSSITTYNTGYNCAEYTGNYNCGLTTYQQMDAFSLYWGSTITAGQLQIYGTRL